MDIFLRGVTQQAMNYAIRSGITITTTYAVKQCTRLLSQAPKSKDGNELMHLQERLQSKIRIISPAIDMIDLISARGNTTLESAVTLTKEIRREIHALGNRLHAAANHEEALRQAEDTPATRQESEQEIQAIIRSMRSLLARIEDAVPLINLAITTSGVNLSTSLSGTISPSRLLQASTFLTAADSKYVSTAGKRQQVGPSYSVSLYMLFAGHAARAVDEKGVRETTWKEVIHKARLKLFRVPLNQLHLLPGDQSPTSSNEINNAKQTESAEYAYQITIIEDLDDGRFHDDDDPISAFDDVQHAGIRDILPAHEISKIFYADTGKLLNIGADGDAHNPVLLLRRDVTAEPPQRSLRRGTEDTGDAFDSDVPSSTFDQSEIDDQLFRESAPTTPLHPTSQSCATERHRLPADLDPEWMAFEVYTDSPDSDDEDDERDLESPSIKPRDQWSADRKLSARMDNLNLDRSTKPSSLPRLPPPVKTSLSLLEMMLKLTALQQFRQESHLAIEDELLNFFLEDSSAAGAGADKSYRQQIRQDAVRRVGFDPYDESPLKVRAQGVNWSPRSDGSLSPRASVDLLPLHGLTFDERFSSPYDRWSHDRDIDRRNSSSPIHRNFKASPSLSSPSRQYIPRRNSGTPGSATSESHRHAVHAKYGHAASPRNSPPPFLLPGSTSPSEAAKARLRPGFIRGQSEPMPTSPLKKEYRRPNGLSTRRTSRGIVNVHTLTEAEEDNA